jgi:glycolate oxidase FAD binding subunit
MSAVLKPRDELDLIEIVAQAINSKTSLAITGGGSKAGMGRPDEATVALGTGLICGITLYEPSELVISARTGTPLQDIELALSNNGQMLAFEPMDYRCLLGSTKMPTIGGLVAANVSGPRRVLFGACRDSLIGIRIVNGLGEIVKSGGRVMKNVTGLDLAKLTCGSWGTLGVLSEVTFKVRPRPECSLSIALHGLDDVAGIAALLSAIASPFEITGAAHLPRNLMHESTTVVRVEGFAESVGYRCGELTRVLKMSGRAEILDTEIADELWRSIRDVSFFTTISENAVWRVSVAPSKAPSVVAQIEKCINARYFYDWAGGLVWLAVDSGGDAGADIVRAAVKAAGGHATLVRAPLHVRASVDVFEPLTSPLRDLTAGLKRSFDPHLIMNPGRMYAGI